MDLPTEKYRLIEWLMSLEDESILKRLQEIKKETLNSDGSNKISDTEKLFIKAGLKDLEKDRTYSHQDVMREVREKYNL